MVMSAELNKYKILSYFISLSTTFYILAKRLTIWKIFLIILHYDSIFLHPFFSILSNNTNSTYNTFYRSNFDSCIGFIIGIILMIISVTLITNYSYIAFTKLIFFTDFKRHLSFYIFANFSNSYRLSSCITLSM